MITQDLSACSTLSVASLDHNFNSKFKCNLPLCNWFRRGNGMVAAVCEMRREIVSEGNRIWLCFGWDCRFHIFHASKKGAAPVAVIDNYICVKIARSIWDVVATFCSSLSPSCRWFVSREVETKQKIRNIVRDFPEVRSVWASQISHIHPQERDKVRVAM